MDPRPINFLFKNYVVPEILDTIKELSSYIQTTENFLQTLYMNKLEEFVNFEKKLGVDELPDGTSVQEFFDLHYRAWPEGRFADLLRLSSAVSIYAFIEFHLMELCNLIQRKDVQLSISHIKGQNYIDKAKVYFSKVLCARFPSNSKEWQEIQIYRRIRNCIVHNGGEIKENTADRRAIEQFIKTNEGLVSITDDRIFLTKGFCEKMLDTTQGFFNLLGESLVDFVNQNESNLENLAQDFGEYYLGRPIRMIYAPIPERFIQDKKQS